MEQLKLKIEENTRPVCYVRMSPEDYARVQKMCEATGESMPELFRKALLKRKDLEQPALSKEDAHEIKVGLNRLGNNVNQIAKHYNAGERPGWNDSWNKFYVAVIDLRHLFLGNYAGRKV